MKTNQAKLVVQGCQKSGFAVLFHFFLFCVILTMYLEIYMLDIVCKWSICGIMHHRIN